MSTAAAFYQGLRQAIDTMIQRAMPFRAVVDSTPDGRVTIVPLAAATPLGEEYARLAGFGLAAGDEVAVLTLGGKPFVLGQVQRSAPTGASVDQPLTVLTSEDNALRVEQVSGTGIFRVSSATSAPFSNVGVLNGVPLTGYSDDAQAVTWSLDGGTGNARFDGAVTAGSVNTPVVLTDFQAGADTASTTSTTTYSAAISRTLSLPTGTWTVALLGGAQFTHSAGGSVAFKAYLDGIDGTAINPTFASASYTQGIAAMTATGRNGDVALKVMYRSSTAGTSSAKNPWLLAIATRTS